MGVLARRSAGQGRDTGSRPGLKCPDQRAGSGVRRPARSLRAHTTTLSYEVVYDKYVGFFRPVTDWSTPQAGLTVPVKFSLGADYGLSVIAAGYPQSKLCGTADGTAVATAAAVPFSFANGQYTYEWKTDKAWKGQCRELLVKLTDNTVKRQVFNFKR